MNYGMPMYYKYKKLKILKYLGAFPYSIQERLILLFANLKLNTFRDI